MCVIKGAHGGTPGTRLEEYLWFMTVYPWAIFTHVMCVIKGAHGGTPLRFMTKYPWVSFTHVLCVIKSAHGGRPEHVQKIYDCIPMGNLYTCNVCNKECPWGTSGRFMTAYPWVCFTHVMCVIESAHGGRPEHVQKIYDYIPMGNLYTCNVCNKECPWGTSRGLMTAYPWVSSTHVMCVIKGAHGGTPGTHPEDL
jgi:hypothetical protein